MSSTSTHDSGRIDPTVDSDRAESDESTSPAPDDTSDARPEGHDDRAPEDNDTTPADTAAPEKRPRWTARVRRRALSPVAVVAVVAVVAAAAAGVVGWKLHRKSEVEAAGRAATDAARSYAVTLTSVDSNNLDRDFAAVLDGSTGEFKDMYTRSSGQLRQMLLDNKATGQGTVLDAAAKSVSDKKVEVLLFIDQTVNNTSSPDPRVDRSRVEMTMELVNGRWLASKVYLP